jgi:hypothetical protein
MIEVRTKFVSVSIFTIEPEDLPVFAREASLTLERRGPLHRGFVESIIMASERKNEVLIVTQWESRHDWSVSQWDEDLGRTMGDLVESAKTFDFHSYEPIAIVRSPVARG